MRDSSQNWYLAFLMFLAIVLPRIASGAPCATAIPACTEWVTVAGRPSRVLIYRTYSIVTRNENITRALIMIHGSGRDADDYFRTALAAAFLAGALDDSIVIAPRFAANNVGTNCQDMLASNELNWYCEPHPDDWRYGGTAVGREAISTFDVIDETLRLLARKEFFPNLRAIVVAGHSGGGSFTARYQAVNTIHEGLNVAITYVAANAASYIYLDAVRPTAAAYPIAASAPGFVPPSPKDPFVQFRGSTTCGAFDTWPYGTRHRRGGSAGITDDQLKKQLFARPINYLVGSLDILPLANFDDSCAAMAQGPTRMARALAFSKYLNEKYSVQHETTVVALCGHNARCMFTANPVLPLIFPKQDVVAR